MKKNRKQFFQSRITLNNITTITDYCHTNSKVPDQFFKVIQVKQRKREFKKHLLKTTKTLKQMNNKQRKRQEAKERKPFKNNNNYFVNKIK